MNRQLPSLHPRKPKHSPPQLQTCKPNMPWRRNHLGGEHEMKHPLPSSFNVTTITKLLHSQPESILERTPLILSAATRNPTGQNKKSVCQHSCFACHYPPHSLLSSTLVHTRKVDPCTYLEATWGPSFLTVHLEPRNSVHVATFLFYFHNTLTFQPDCNLTKAEPASPKHCSHWHRSPSRYSFCSQSSHQQVQ